jgi:hypothetical protein
MQQLIEQFADKAQNSTLGSTRTTLAPCRVRAAWLPASANSALRYSEKCRICSHCIPTSDLRPPTSVLCPLSSVLCPLSSVLCPLSSVLCPLSSVLCPLSSVLCPLLSYEYISLTNSPKIHYR